MVAEEGLCFKKTSLSRSDCLQYCLRSGSCKALKEEAHWIPGDGHVLSALTIQAMDFLNGQTAVIDRNLANPEYEDWVVITAVNTFSMIHSSRVMLCMLVAYFPSGMASPI